MNRRRKKPPLSRRMAAGWIAILAMVIVELFSYAWCRVQCINTGYAITQANDRTRELVALKKNLKIEIERLKSPERIARIAQETIGLVKPTPDNMVIVQ